MRSLFFFAALLLLVPLTLADGPGDNVADNVRAVPPVGIELSEADRNELSDGLAELNAKIEQLRKSKDLRVQSLMPDVEIFSRAIRDATGRIEQQEVARMKVPCFTKTTLAKPAKYWPKDTLVRTHSKTATLPGPRKPAWSCEDSSRVSTTRFSPMVSWYPSRTNSAERASIEPTCGYTDAENGPRNRFSFTNE